MCSVFVCTYFMHCVVLVYDFKSQWWRQKIVLQSMVYSCLVWTSILNPIYVLELKLKRVQRPLLRFGLKAKATIPYGEFRLTLRDLYYCGVSSS